MIEPLEAEILTWTCSPMTRDLDPRLRLYALQCPGGCDRGFAL